VFILFGLCSRAKLNPCQGDQLCLSHSLEVGWREGCKEGGPGTAMQQLHQPAHTARAVVPGQQKLTGAMLASATQRPVSAWKYIYPFK